jgi:c-di-GMP-binding flagellar brake protein YcgR
MIVIQTAVIIFLLLVVLIVYQDERKKRKLARKSATLDRFWDNEKNSGGKDTERRKSVRIDTKINVSYEVVSTNADKKRNSISSNISKGGINLALDEKLLPETTMDLQLNLPQRSRPIHVRGKIVWVKEIPQEFAEKKGDRFFATGIQFIQIIPKDEIILHKFIDRQIKDTHAQSEKL